LGAGVLLFLLCDVGLCFLMMSRVIYSISKQTNNIKAFFPSKLYIPSARKKNLELQQNAHRS
jgi:hypothetical protein